MAVSKRLRHEILRRDNYRCKHCGATADDARLTIDHVTAVALGGSDLPGNLQALCADCNAGKSATPPDAALVAEVDARAIRWADALQRAADRMLSNLAHRAEEVAEFDHAWLAWTYTDGNQKRHLPRPAGWEQSVKEFLAAGLPMAVLIDCACTAMGRDKVKLDDKFRYACGIAWKLVAQLQEEARAGVEPATVEESAETEAQFWRGRGDFAEDILLTLGDEARTQGERWVDEETSAEDRLPDTAMGAVSSLQEDYRRLERTIDRLFEIIPASIAQSSRDTATGELNEYMGEDWRPADLLARTVWAFANSTAQAYLDSLPSAEREEWLACARNFAKLKGDAAYIAAQYALMRKANPVFRLGLCSADGDHGAMCPQRERARVSYIDCPRCAHHLADYEPGEPCGEHRLCERHLEAGVSGELAFEGELLIVKDFEYLPDAAEAA